VFLDVKMPELDGFQTLRWIRGEERLNGVSVVMLSGSGEARDTELAQRLGADAYLVKYPPPDVFARLVADAGRGAVSGKVQV
jgi:DNA-binding response OmpR family regulator